MKPYLLAFSLVLFFSFSLNAQSNSKVTKKPKVTSQKLGKQNPGEKNWGHGEIDSLPFLKDPGRNTPQTRGVQSNANGSTLPFKGSDEELQAIQSRRRLNGTNNVVDHKSDDQKLQGTQSRRRLRGGNNVVDHKADDQKIQARGNRNANQNRGTQNINRKRKGGGQGVVMSGGSTMIKKGGKQNRNRKSGTTKRKRKNN